MPAADVTSRDHGQQVWMSHKWNYRIAFPSDWSKPRPAGPRILSPGMDVYSENDAGASTAVFCYSYHPLRDIEDIADQLVGNYRKLGRVSIIGKQDMDKNAGPYRTVEFRFGRRGHFTAYDTVVFRPNMQLVVSSNAPTTSYDGDRPVFSAIVDSVAFQSSDEKFPIRPPNLWKSAAWGYSIEFPASWNDVAHGPFPEIESADCRCDAWWGSSTVVFAYPKRKSEQLDDIEENIMASYRRRGRSFRILETRDIDHKVHSYRTTIFEWTAPDRSERKGHYTMVLSKQTTLLVSSQVASRYFETDRTDFDAIVSSITIEDV